MRLELRASNPKFPTDGGIDPDLVEKMRAKYPDGSNHGSWMSASYNHDDTALNEMLDHARSIGIVIPPDESSVKSGVRLCQYSDTSKSLREQSHFVEPRLIGSIPANISFDSSGMPFTVLDTHLKKGKSHEIGGAFAFGFIIVRGDLRNRILDTGLKGLSFLKVKIGENRSIKDPAQLSEDWPKGIEPLYLLSSDVELPACKNWLYDDAGRVFHPLDPHTEPRTFYPLNGRENMGPLHYSKDEIEPFLGYDIVKPCEKFHPFAHIILVSNRFQSVFKILGVRRMKYDLGYFAVIDESPWELGTDGPRHSRYSGPPPNPPVD